MSDEPRNGTCRDCLSRREFLARGAGGAVLTFASLSAGGAVAACGDGITAPKSEHVAIVVGSFPGLATIGTLVKVGPSHAAKRTGATTFDAYSMFCTHAGCATFLSAQQFLCPCHGSKFGSDGAVLQGPASSSLPKLPTSYNATTDTLTIN